MSPSTELEPEVLQRNILIVSSTYLVVYMISGDSPSLATLTGLMILEYTWNIRFERRIIWP